MNKPLNPLQINSLGWLEGVRICPSPHFHMRLPHTFIDLLVIHGITVPPGDHNVRFIDDLFLAQLSPIGHPEFLRVYNMTVSAHCLIERSGEITQYVSFEHAAWHAGASAFQERTNCNDFSIGIELVGTDDAPYTHAQYQTLARLTRVLQARYPALHDQRHLVGHSDIAPGRKTDPGPFFEWPYFLALVGSKTFEVGSN